MKTKYTEYVVEQVNSQNFSQEYDTIRDSLEDFWGLLQDKIEEFSEVNSRNLQEVATFNQKIRDQRNNKKPQQPTASAPVQGQQYNYKNNNNQLEVVKILVADNGEKTNTAEVQNVSTGTKYPAKWDRLSPIKQKQTP